MLFLKYIKGSTSNLNMNFTAMYTDHSSLFFFFFLATSQPVTSSEKNIKVNYN